MNAAQSQEGDEGTRGSREADSTFGARNGSSPTPIPDSAPPSSFVHLLICKEGAGEEERWPARGEK